MYLWMTKLLSLKVILEFLFRPGSEEIKKVLALSEGGMLVATDNDFHITDLVPSVELVGDIPETPKDSF